MQPITIESRLGIDAMLEPTYGTPQAAEAIVQHRQTRMQDAEGVTHIHNTVLMVDSQYPIKLADRVTYPSDENETATGIVQYVRPLQRGDQTLLREARI